MFNGGSTGVCINADFSGMPYQLARGCINRDMRDYLFFCTDDGYFLLFSEDLGRYGRTWHPAEDQDTYYIQHVLEYETINEGDPDEQEVLTADYWRCTYYEHTNIGVIAEDGQLLYGSDPDLPDLRTGVEHYAFAWSWLALCCVFGLCFLGVCRYLYRRR